MNLLAYNRAPSPAWRAFRLPQYTSIGCYTIGYYDLQAGDMLCAACASFEQFKVRLDSDVFWEGPDEPCAACNKPIESSYGDPDAPEPERA